MNKINKDIATFWCLCLSVILILLMGCKKKTDPEPVLETGTMSDRQGNVYNTVRIGNQWWMAENLKVKVYNDSTPVVEVKMTEKDSMWSNKKVGAYCAIDSRYGLHYNWYVISDLKRIAPEGWHIPSDEEWKNMEMAIGMSRSEVDKTSWRGENESEKLLPESSTGWPTNSVVYGTNKFGFTALPGGCRVFNGIIGEVTTAAYWWSSSENTPSSVWCRSVSSGHSTIFRYFVNKNYGLTIRCVKD